VIEGDAVVLQPIAREVAVALLEGREPEGIAFADGYPSQFSLEVMDLVGGPRAATPDGEGFCPCFVVRKEDGVVLGEIGCSRSSSDSSARVGYSIVERCKGRGYATDALRALLAWLRSDPRVERITAETLTGHGASRRVMEKAGMRLCEERLGEVGGELVDLAVYEAA
jgi:RimJ/RimL family protein N-acetyltransferase